MNLTEMLFEESNRLDERENPNPAIPVETPMQTLDFFFILIYCFKT